jgi:hypothetical protein
MSVQSIVTMLASYRFPLSAEKATQAAIEDAFKAHQVEHRREYRLSAEDVVDFFIPEDAIAVEVKIKGSKRAIFAQVSRYAKHESVREIILVTNVPMGMPQVVQGKPIHVINLASAWL